MEYWFLSVPLERDERVFDRVRDKLTKPANLCDCAKFSIPQDFKVGTLDILVGLSDELGKLDNFSESITRKLVQYMADILEEQKSHLADHLKINEEDINVYISKFQWDAAKFPIRQSLEQINSSLSEHLSKIDSGLKAKAASYNQVKGSLQAYERKQTGSLLTRNLSEFVKKEDFVIDSEYLVTLLVVVPKMYSNVWRAKYEQLTEYVVPRSSEQIYSDGEHGLWTVTLFRKIANDFVQRAKEQRFFVRDFVYDEKEIHESKSLEVKLKEDKKKSFTSTFRWLKINFGESFIGLVHVKALRIFVESVLRYGLPVNFAAMLLKPPKRNHKRVREVLSQMFGNLESAAMALAIDSEDIPGLMSASEYYPYVSFKLDTNFTDTIR